MKLKLIVRNQEGDMKIANTATMETGSKSAETHDGWSNISVGGWAVAMGAVGVTATSIFYAVSPRAAALPQPFDGVHALIGAIDGAATLHAAGTIGIFSDLIMAAGASLIAFEMANRRRGAAAIGWAILILAIVIFIFVDALAGYVLSPVAALGGDSHAFVGFKRLFDALFLLGTAASGAGTMFALIAEAKSAKPLISKAVCHAGTFAGFLGLIAAVACLCGWPLDLVAGGSILLVAVVFCFAGLQIACAESTSAIQ